MARRPFKASDLLIALGFVLIVIGAWKLAERALSSWWPSFAQAFGAMAAVLWPLAIIVVGVLVIVAAQRGRFEQKGRRLCRSRSRKVVAGVCGGMAEYFGSDATAMRLVWVVLAVLSFGVGCLAYLVCWIVTPLERPASRRHQPQDVEHV